MRFLISLLCIVLFAHVGIGCSGSEAAQETEYGKANFALTSAEGYRLTGDIHLHASFAGGEHLVFSVSTEEDTLSISLLAGAYIPTLLENWALFDEHGVDVTSDVSSFAFSPNTIHITNGNTTDVTLTFQVGEDSVALTFGAVSFIAVVNEGDCTPSCGDGESCVSQNGGDATCLTDCADHDDCGDGESCFSGSCVDSPIVP